MRYLIGRDNLAVTLFVPYDCPNNCPFCTSKKDYADRKGFSLDSILESLGKVLQFNAVKDVVITGGEPFANLDQLDKILCFIRSIEKKYNRDYNVFINTTLPAKNKEKAQELLTYIQQAFQNNYITGLNVSRHIGFKTNLEYDRLINQLCILGVSLRINSVMVGDETIDEIESFIDRFSYVSQINFRADYRKIVSQDDLRGYNHPLLQKLFSICDYEYSHSTGCHVCNTDSFKSTIKGYPIVSLHRGMEYSKMVLLTNEVEEINDIVIKQDGRILFDWDEITHTVDELKASGWSYRTESAARMTRTLTADVKFGFSNDTSHRQCGYSKLSC